jgi:hypothetical protein
MVIYSHLLLFL